MDFPSITFGTDGWRAVIADGFTFSQVARVAQASAQVLAHTYPGEGIVVGYDNRFLSEHFARRAAEAVAALDLPVLLSTGAAPTPAFSWAAKHRGAHGALVITASHNPPHYSGIKIKGGFGGSVGLEVTQAVEQTLSQTQQQIPDSDRVEHSIHLFDPWPDYCQQLSSKVDLEKLRSSGAKVWIDAMHGSAAGGMTRLLGDTVVELRAKRDPLFGGAAPEPLPPQLAETMHSVGADPAPLKVALVFDGDGDRIAALDGAGTFLSPQALIPILMEHLVERRGFTGELVKTVSGSQLFARLADQLKIPVTETPVGFKYIAERMMATRVILGGEESGGIGFPDHMPERDAMLSALYLLEAVADTGLDLGQLYARIQARVGYASQYHRIDLHLQDPEHQARLMRDLATSPPTEILGSPVARHSDVDGHKFLLQEGSWLMIRSSGTEPLLRLYCEALERERVMQLLDWAKEWALG